ncbi:HAD family acid phosphatase [Sphingomonas sp. PB2P19]|uniref:HAD family acid phosphatase n=1 Tax=Sphingomonas rhamnosi TaxID=3096156 RepID=UPI002FC80F57
MRHRATLALATAALVLQGCAAAAIPIVAGGFVGRAKLQDRKSKRPDKRKTSAYRLVDMKELPRPTAAATAAATAGATAAATGGTVPGAMQYLYGSGEAAALDLQAYMALANYLVGLPADRSIGHDVPSVVIAPGSTLDAPRFVPCGSKPLAIVFDIDETAVLNLGYEADAARRGETFDSARWAEWERTGGGHVAVVPGLLDVIKVARITDITVIFNSNRSVAHAAETAAMLDRIGLGPVVHGDTLWLQGDAGGTGSGKDARRWAIAAKYCVVAMSGDQLGDFTDLFNASSMTPPARREAVGGRKVSLMWGRGWFMLPNPVYGTGLKGDFDTVFPPATRWTPNGVAK